MSYGANFEASPQQCNSDLKIVSLLFTEMAAHFVSKRVDKDDWMGFGKDINKNTKITIPFNITKKNAVERVDNTVESSVKTLHYITLHYITLHYITLHYIILFYFGKPPAKLVKTKLSSRSKQEHFIQQANIRI